MLDAIHRKTHLFFYDNKKRKYQYQNKRKLKTKEILSLTLKVSWIERDEQLRL
jgi:hypothetical protein